MSINIENLKNVYTTATIEGRGPCVCVDNAQLQLVLEECKNKTVVYIRHRNVLSRILLTQHVSDFVKTSCSCALPQGLGFEIAPAYSALYMS